MSQWQSEGLPGAAHCTQAPTRRGLSSVSSPLQLRKQKCSGDPNGILPFLVVPEQPGQEEEEESKMANDGYEAVSNSLQGGTPVQPPNRVAMMMTTAGASVESKAMTGEELSQAAAEEKKRKRKLAVAAASRANRLKKKKEFEALRDTNKKLLKERQMLVQMIQDLKSELEANRHTDDPVLLAENLKLQKSVKTYRGTVKRLRSLLDGVPDS